eukprot:Tamp_13522.p1 GENE.Tamp_13522~~Tamp_13522.p1  ORF type:complete len:249 (+),score=55.01 Tamp_13522:99-845(+)
MSCIQVDFSFVKMAGAAKIAANMPPVDKMEDTPEIAVLRDREVKKLIKHVRTTCSRSVSLCKEPGNALTRFFFLSSIATRRKVAGAQTVSDPLIPYNAGKDSCLHRELLKAGLDPAESEQICNDLSSAASEAVQVVHDLRSETTRNPTSFVDEVQQKEAQNRQMLICWKDDVLTINREHFLKVEKLYEKHTGAEDPKKILFVVRLFCMLMRYESIGGPGYQAAVPSGVFDVMRREFDVQAHILKKHSV